MKLAINRVLIITIDILKIYMYIYVHVWLKLWIKLPVRKLSNGIINLLLLRYKNVMMIIIASGVGLV